MLEITYDRFYLCFFAARIAISEGPIFLRYATSVPRPVNFIIMPSMKVRFLNR
jgi:hypothetical protein